MGLFGGADLRRNVPRGLLDPQGTYGIVAGDRPPIDMGDFPMGRPSFPTPGTVQQPQKRKHNWGGIAADFLAGLAGQPGPYLQMMQHRQQIEDQEARAQRERQERHDEWLFQQQWQRDHPAPRTNDTIEDFNWYKGLNSGDRAIYDQMHPVYRIGPDGLPYPMARTQGQQPPEILPPDFDFGGAASSATPPFGVSRSQLDQITMMAESGGDPNAVSPRGARGRMQVMPSTARDPGFGIRPSNGTPDDDERVGREYRAAMQRRYGGDPAKMWAAYNWGPGNLDNAISRYGERWLEAAPAETRNYVSRNVRALGGR